MYTSCFNLSLSDEQVAELSSVNPLALGKTFTNCTGLLKHYFIPILLSEALDRMSPYSLKRFNLTKQEAIQEWIMSFVKYGILPDYSVEDLMSMGVMGIPDDLKSQYVEDVFQQQFDSYKNHNSANAETSSSSRTSDDSTCARTVNAFL